MQSLCPANPRLGFGTARTFPHRDVGVTARLQWPETATPHISMGVSQRVGALREEVTILWSTCTTGHRAAAKTARKVCIVSQSWVDMISLISGLVCRTSVARSPLYKVTLSACGLT